MIGRDEHCTTRSDRDRRIEIEISDRYGAKQEAINRECREKLLAAYQEYKRELEELQREDS
jgi:hypothetical protein